MCVCVCVLCPNQPILDIWRNNFNHSLNITLYYSYLISDNYFCKNTEQDKCSLFLFICIENMHIYIYI